MFLNKLGIFQSKLVNLQRKRKQKRMKSIKEAANEYAKDYLFSPLPQRAPNKHFEAGANYVLDDIEEFMTTMNLGNNAAEKFYKSDLIADIHGFIEQLKGNK
jgi:hypothetical protein